MTNVSVIVLGKKWKNNMRVTEKETISLNQKCSVYYKIKATNIHILGKGEAG